MRRLFLLLLCLIAPTASFTAVQLSANLSFTPPTTYTDGTPILAGTVLSYNVYQGVDGGTKSKIAIPAGTQPPILITSGLASGHTYCWEVTSLVGSSESDHSNEACKTFPEIPKVPRPVVLTVT